MKKRKLSYVGLIIKKRLLELNKTQAEFAREIGVQEKYLYLILIGERSGKKYMQKIIQALEIDPETLESIA